MCVSAHITKASVSLCASNTLREWGQAGMNNNRVNTKHQFCRILALLVRRLPAPTPPLYWVSGASAATHKMCTRAWVHCVFVCVRRILCVRVYVHTHWLKLHVCCRSPLICLCMRVCVQAGFVRTLNRPWQPAEYRASDTSFFRHHHMSRPRVWVSL